MEKLTWSSLKGFLNRALFTKMGVLPGQLLHSQRLRLCDFGALRDSKIQGLLNGGGVQTGGFPALDLSFLFCPFWDFPDLSGIFPICSGMVRGFSRFVPFLFLGLLRAPTRNSPEKGRRHNLDLSRTKNGNPPGLETQRRANHEVHIVN